MNHKDICHIDFETRSAVNLKETGVDVYAKDKSTDALCLAYAIGDAPVELWRLGDKNPTDLFDFMKCDSTIIKAHNASFEYNLWNSCAKKKYGWPELPLMQLECTMVQAYSMGLPGSLENASLACGMTKKKDMAGHRIMLQLSQPREVKAWGEVIWWEAKSAKSEKDKIEILKKFDQLYAYCKTDVEVERELDKRLLRLQTKERALWILDQKINNHGVKVDVPALKIAKQLADYEKDRLNNEIKNVSEGAISTCNAVEQIKDFLADFGVAVPSISKGDVSNLLEDEALPAQCREVLELRKVAAKSSTAKIEAMLLSYTPGDERVRGNFQFYGAGTGRWAGRRIQLHNLPRSKIGPMDVETVFRFVEQYKADNANLSAMIGLTYGSTLSTLSDCVRGFLVPEKGKQFLARDYNAIEARVLAWLAGEESVLDVFRSGRDIYKHAASGIYGLSENEIDDAKRQIGKVSILALGYGGGKGAFQTMGKGYGVKVGDIEAEAIKKRWRQSNPYIVRYWYALEEAAVNAVKNPGQIFQAGAKGREVKFKMAGSFLLCTLPSGRNMIYAYPTVENVETPWGEMKEAMVYKCENQTTRKWGPQITYGGYLSENITQAVSRDILCEAMLALHKRGFTIALHVHDEIVCEEDIDGPNTLDGMGALMNMVPKWAEGLPIKTGGWQGTRYRK